MKTFIVLLCAAFACAMASPLGEWEMDWESWKVKYEKAYAPLQEAKRQTIWEKNFHRVMKHNYEYDLGKHTYRLGMNKFADMEAEEFKALYLSATGFVRNADSYCGNGSFFSMSFATIPDTVDWRPKGYVTPIKDQKQCGSCWAFSTTGSLEGQHFRKTGKLVSLSEQNLVDCSGKFGNMGCEGGLMDQAFEYIKENKGIDTEESYPYKAVQGTCMFDENNVGATLNSCVDIPSKDESALGKAVASVGPISVAIDASHFSFQLYKDGVYFEEACSETVLDHGVLVVGYGSDTDGGDYWLVKNSWGLIWGDKGYIKMSRNKKNNCGISTQASYPVV